MFVCYIENVKTEEVVATKSLIFRCIQRTHYRTSEVGTVIPAMKALPLALAKTQRLRRAVFVCVCVFYYKENVKEQHQGKAERQSIKRERKRPHLISYVGARCVEHIVCITIRGELTLLEVRVCVTT